MQNALANGKKPWQLSTRLGLLASIPYAPKWGVIGLVTALTVKTIYIFLICNGSLTIYIFKYLSLSNLSSFEVTKCSRTGYLLVEHCMLLHSYLFNLV